MQPSVITYQPHVVVCASLLKQTNLSLTIQAPLLWHEVQQTSPEGSPKAIAILALDVAQQDADGTRSSNSVHRLVLPCLADVANQPPTAGFHVLAGTWYGDVISSYTHAHKHPDLESNVMDGLTSCFPVFSMFFPLWALPPPSAMSVVLIDFCSPCSMPSLACLCFPVRGSGQLHSFVFISYWSAYISVYIHIEIWDPRSRSQQRNEGRVSAEDCPGYLVICLPQLIILLSATAIHFYHFNKKKTSCGTPFFNYFQSLWSPLCSGRSVYFSSLAINTNKTHTNPLSANKLLRDADSSHTLSDSHMNIDTHPLTEALDIN